ncbi:MAG: hypothetical protein J0H68_01675 [Sphingobacteriia bacterium]|nr:hypothetical protein [Sphingobacteriia bacterium]
MSKRKLPKRRKTLSAMEESAINSLASLAGSQSTEVPQVNNNINTNVNINISHTNVVEPRQETSDVIPLGVQSTQPVVVNISNTNVIVPSYLQHSSQPYQIEQNYEYQYSNYRQASQQNYRQPFPLSERHSQVQYTTPLSVVNISQHAPMPKTNVIQHAPVQVTNIPIQQSDFRERIAPTSNIALKSAQFEKPVPSKPISVEAFYREEMVRKIQSSGETTSKNRRPILPKRVKVSEIVDLTISDDKEKTANINNNNNTNIPNTVSITNIANPMNVSNPVYKLGSGEALNRNDINNLNRYVEARANAIADMVKDYYEKKSDYQLPIFYYLHNIHNRTSEKPDSDKIYINIELRPHLQRYAGIYGLQFYDLQDFVWENPKLILEENNKYQQNNSHRSNVEKPSPTIRRK